MRLDALAPELLIQILQATETPRDLWATVTAIPACFRVLKASPGLILGASLRDAMDPEVLRTVLAIFDIRHVQKGDENDEGDLAAIHTVEEFSNNYFQSISHQQPLEHHGMHALMTIRRMYIRASTFSANYFARAMGRLGFPDPQSHKTPIPDAADHQLQPYLPPMSPTERARLQRAFFRYEIYSRLFPADPESPRGSLLPGYSQFNRFLSRMEPWEVEELNCVHQYFVTMIGEFMDHLEDQVVKAVRDANLSVSCTDPTVDMVPFDCLNLPEMSLYTVSGRIRSISTLSYLASLGLSFVYRLYRGNETQRKGLIRANTLTWRDYLPEALEYAPEHAPVTVIPDFTDSDNDILQPNLGYFWYKRSNRDIYLRTHSQGVQNKALRERGYVFWDDSRIRGQLVSDNLQRAKEVDAEEVSRSNRYRGLSVEERTAGIRVPRDQVPKICREFGSTMTNW